MKQPVTLFFIGKGGVGKSTSAALTAISLAREGKNVLLSSMDPAHNQSDILGVQLSARPRALMPNLNALEVDPDAWIQKYLDGIHTQISRSYTYLTALNLDSWFNVMKHSPGLEAHALLLAFETLVKTHASLDYLLFDMPPTALSLQFFRLPGLSLIWIDQLLALRKEIIEKRRIITTIRFGKKTIETDKVLTRIISLGDHYRALKKRFEDPDLTRINLVTNPEHLAEAESSRIVNALTELGITGLRMIRNKTGEDSVITEMPGTRDIPFTVFPLSREPLIGIQRLVSFLDSTRNRQAHDITY